ncbi:MAG: phosphoglycerate mutase family protein [archaeon]
MTTQVIFIRHGESFDYKLDQLKYPGPGLTRNGKKQARITGNYLKSFSFDKIYCSNMTRCIETAEEIKKFQKCNISYHRELAEYNQIIFEQNPKDFDKLKTNIKRAKKTKEFFRNILIKNKNKRILIVSHGNAIRCMIGTSLGFSIRKTPDLDLFNCSISTLFFDKEKVVGLYSINSTDHYNLIKFTQKINLNKLS